MTIDPQVVERGGDADICCCCKARRTILGPERHVIVAKGERESVNYIWFLQPNAPQQSSCLAKELVMGGNSSYHKGGIHAGLGLGKSSGPLRKRGHVYPSTPALLVNALILRVVALLYTS